MKCPSSLLALILGFVLFAVTGCQTPEPTRVNPNYTAPTQSAATPPSGAQAAPDSSAADVQPATAETTDAQSVEVIFNTNQIKVTKTVLEEASVGGIIQYRIQLHALEDVHRVRVTETMPEGIAFKSASPATSLTDNQVSWLFASIQQGSTQTIDVSVTPTQEGHHHIQSIVSVDNHYLHKLFSGQPKLDVVKQGPTHIELGEIATWTVTVTNNGTANATGVVVTDTLPEAFEPTSSLRQVIGTLSTGETRTVEYSAKAVAQGEFRNHAVATYEGGPDSSSDASASHHSSVPITVVQSGIRVRKNGPEEAYVFKPVPFTITIENTGDTDLKNVRITDLLPEGSSVADNGRGRVSGNAIGWMIPNLPAGASQLITTEIAATGTGQSTNTVKVLTENGLEASDTVTTNWLAVPGVTVSITDTKDPVRVNEATIYKIKVSNQGKFEPVSGTVTVTFNDKIKPISVAGDAQGTIDGQTVTFPRTTLEPGKDTELSITAEGANIGPGRAAMNFSADFLSDPIISQETTNVY
jgi:uncharacterized repeat protein (TIGR01451 family)